MPTIEVLQAWFAVFQRSAADDVPEPAKTELRDALIALLLAMLNVTPTGTRGRR